MLSISVSGGADEAPDDFTIFKKSDKILFEKKNLKKNLGKINHAIWRFFWNWFVIDFRFRWRLLSIWRFHIFLKVIKYYMKNKKIMRIDDFFGIGLLSVSVSGGAYEAFVDFTFFKKW